MWSNIIAKAGETPEQRRRIDDEMYWNKRTGGVKMEKQKLAVGEKYLSVRINIGGQNFSFAAFKNKDKKGLEPDYKGNNIGVWLATKKEKDDKHERVEDL